MANEAKRPKDIIDRTGDWTFMKELVNHFGGVSSARVLGWAFLIGTSLREGETTVEAVERLIAAGYSRSGAYKVVHELHGFKAHLEQVESERQHCTVKVPIEQFLSEVLSQSLS